jgi:general secretion pathway protein K
MIVDDLKGALLRERRLPGSRRPPRPLTRRQRGIALVMVLGSIAILTAVAVEFQYQSDVDLQLAINGRDELRADYMARSAINMSRLVLRFQKQLDGQTAMLGPMLAQLGLSGGAGGAGGGINIRLWEIIPVDCSMFQMLLGATKTPSAAAPEPPKFGEGLKQSGGAGEALLALKGEKVALQSFGDFQGCFNAEIKDEEQKINLNRLDMTGASGRPPMMQALILLADPRFEWVFDKADANGVKMTPQEVLIALHDWIDERDTQNTLDVLGSGPNPFPEGFGDENRNYLSKYPFRYRSKNASFDTLDEIYQVDGVSDLFMAAFRDRITVYPDKNRLLNINTDDKVQQILNIYSVAKDPNDMKLRNAVIIQSILEQIAYTKMFSFLGMSTGTFVSIVESNGIAINADIKANVANNRWITDKSETFTVKAVGQAGRVERTVTAVIRYNDLLGKVLYYRQE